MSAGARTLTTLLVLTCLLVLAALWGFSAATKPFPGKTAAPVCVDRSISKGDKVFATDVTVSVVNASTRNGLAGRTLALLVAKGFGDGTAGNAGKKTHVDYAQIWTTDPRSPAVALVRSWLGPAHVVRHAEHEPGVLVVVGDAFGKLSKGERRVVAEENTTICSPSFS